MANVKERVKKALDGRTFRWLAVKINVHESDLNKKLSGDKNFTDIEKTKINKLLNITV